MRLTAQPERQHFIDLAARHDLVLDHIARVDDLGLDYRVAEAVDAAGRRWILRIPRRESA